MEGFSRSSICPLEFGVQLQPWLDGQGGDVFVVHRKEISLARFPVQQSSSFEGLHLVLDDLDSI